MSWQPIETAPKGWNAPEILVWSPSRMFVGTGVYYLARWDEERQRWENTDEGYEIDDLTHWALLPAPPPPDEPLETK